MFDIIGKMSKECHFQIDRAITFSFLLDNSKSI